MGLVDEHQGDVAVKQTQMTAKAGHGQDVREDVRVAQSAGGGWFGGMLGGLNLRGPQGTSREKGLPPPGSYTVGEVHGDYVKVSCVRDV